MLGQQSQYCIFNKMLDFVDKLRYIVHVPISLDSEANRSQLSIKEFRVSITQQTNAQLPGFSSHLTNSME
jgi:hypothetical protein